MTLDISFDTFNLMDISKITEINLKQNDRRVELAMRMQLLLDSCVQLEESIAGKEATPVFFKLGKE